MNSEMKIAGIWSRIGGAIIDLIIILILCVVVMFSWSFFVGYVDPFSASRLDQGDWKTRGFLAGLAIDYLYTAILQSGSKQGTCGQRVMGLQVIKKDGSAVTFGTASIRYFVSLVSSILFKIGYAIAIFTEKKQTLHDLAAGVVVIRRLSNVGQRVDNSALRMSIADSSGFDLKTQSKTHLNMRPLTAQSTEEDMWAFASNEMSSSHRNEGLWAMCFAATDGNDDKAKVLYLKRRVAQLVSDVTELRLSSQERKSNVALNGTTPNTQGFASAVNENKIVTQEFNRRASDVITVVVLIFLLGGFFAFVWIDNDKKETRLSTSRHLPTETMNYGESRYADCIAKVKSSGTGTFVSEQAIIKQCEVEYRPLEKCLTDERWEHCIIIRNSERDLLSYRQYIDGDREFKVKLFKKFVYTQDLFRNASLPRREEIAREFGLSLNDIR
jgi:uncharacterized RDD family membrane protein YckC